MNSFHQFFKKPIRTLTHSICAFTKLRLTNNTSLFFCIPSLALYTMTSAKFNDVSIPTAKHQ